jgi:hypothetical protein
MNDVLQYSTLSPPSDDDRGTLQLLGIIYTVLGGLDLAGFLILLIASITSDLSPPMPLIAILCFLAAAAIFTLSGVGMLLRRFRMLSFAVAICICLGFPVGTIVGVWTIIVLNKPGVLQLYRGGN